MSRHALRKIHVVFDKMSTTPKVVPVWEVPLFRERFEIESEGEAPEGSKLAGEVDPAAEYQRLANFHGRDAETKQLLVELHYGRGEAGIRKLGEAIADALVDPAKTKPAAKSEPAK